MCLWYQYIRRCHTAAKETALIGYMVSKTLAEPTEIPKVRVTMIGPEGEHDRCYDLQKSAALDLARELLDVVSHMETLGY